MSWGGAVPARVLCRFSMSLRQAHGLHALCKLPHATPATHRVCGRCSGMPARAVTLLARMPWCVHCASARVASPLELCPARKGAALQGRLHTTPSLVSRARKLMSRSCRLSGSWWFGVRRCLRRGPAAPAPGSVGRTKCPRRPRLPDLLVLKCTPHLGGLLAAWMACHGSPGAGLLHRAVPQPGGGKGRLARHVRFAEFCQVLHLLLSTLFWCHTNMCGLQVAQDFGCLHSQGPHHGMPARLVKNHHCGKVLPAPCRGDWCLTSMHRRRPLRIHGGMHVAPPPSFMCTVQVCAGVLRLSTWEACGTICKPALTPLQGWQHGWQVAAPSSTLPCHVLSGSVAGQASSPPVAAATVPVCVLTAPPCRRAVPIVLCEHLNP